jgi:gag-polyprotein putative aspartyl protease/aspartyl protease
MAFAANPSGGKYPDTFDSVEFKQALTSAYELLGHDDYRTAIARFTTLADEHPDSDEAQLGLLSALFGAGDYAGASRAAQNALQANPASAPLHAAFGDLYFRLAEFDHAEQEYRKSLSLDDKLVRAWIGMGRVFSAQSMGEEARNAFSRAWEINPEVLTAWMKALPSPEQRKIYGSYVTADSDLSSQTGCKIIGPAVTGGSSRAEKLSIPLVSIYDDYGVVRGLGPKVKINRQASAILLLDTGASGIIIGHKLAEKAGVVRLADRKMIGIGGTGRLDGYIGHVTTLRIGALELRDCLVEVSAEDTIVGQDGLIGTHVFAQYLVTVDFKWHKLELETPPDKFNQTTNHSMPVGIQAFFFGHLVLVPATIGNDASGLFVVDSGANRSTISPDLAAQVGRMWVFDRKAKGLTGSTENRMMTDNAPIKLGNVVLRNQTVVTLDLSQMSKRVGTRIMGQIGFTALAQVKLVIDYRHGRLIFDTDEFEPSIPSRPLNNTP